MRSRVELLAPAGSFDALRAAVQNGADAVYLGGTNFGARAFANNFDEEEMKQAIAYAHTYGVRVFVTVNTLIKQHEMDACLAYVKMLQELDVDALIIQDIGLFTQIRKYLPDMELHASTQMHIHNEEGIKLLKDMGAARVVLPRETCIEQIHAYSTLGVDLEVFVQGALCISYSGQCLMSALTLQRSGNRGECAQSCRMRYQLACVDNDEPHIIKAKGSYLLSPKDLNTLSHVPELIDAGIYSFKIEGRMKRPEYVALMVSCYRKAIDAYFAKKPFHVDKVMEEEMQKIFHRGFTAGHLFHQMGSSLMNYRRPNHMGIHIGNIIDVKKDKVAVRLDKPLYQGDGIRIINDLEDEGFTVNRIYKDGLLVNHGDIHDVIEFDKTFYAKKGYEVVKTSDVKQLQKLKESYEIMQRKVPVYGMFTMQINDHACLEVMDDDGHQVHVVSQMPCEAAKKTALDASRIKQQLNKTKDTPFTFEHIECRISENGILPIKEINRMRREALQQLSDQRKIRHFSRRVCDIENTSMHHGGHLDPLLCVVHTEEQYQACRESGVPMIFIEGNALYQKHKEEEHVYLRTPRVMKQAYTKECIMIQEHGGAYQGKDYIADTSCNITNAYAASHFFKHHALGVCFSIESSLYECEKIAEAFYHEHHHDGSFIYPIYGREELMLSEYCVINAVVKDNDKTSCGLCRQHAYSLLDIHQHEYPIMCDDDCRMHILNSTPGNHIQDIKEAKHHHISSFLCVFTKETKEECQKILMEIKRELDT